MDLVQVMDQLRQVFDRVDVVMRRRADQGDARLGSSQLGDVTVDLSPRQLSPFTRLGPLRHLDLQLLGGGEIPCRHSKST